MIPIISKGTSKIKAITATRKNLTFTLSPFQVTNRTCNPSHNYENRRIPKVPGTITCLFTTVNKDPLKAKNCYRSRNQRTPGLHIRTRLYHLLR